MRFRDILLPGILGLVVQTASAQGYLQNFEGFTTGTGSPDGWWKFEGPATTTSVLTAQPVGVGGSQALELNLDASGAVGTDWYFYAGIGRGALVSSLNAIPSDVMLSLDVALFGATSPTALVLTVQQWDPDLNANVWSNAWTPTLTIDGSFTHVNFVLGTGTSSGTYNPALGLDINSIAFNSGGFPLAAGNRVIIDNVELAVVPEPSSMVVLGLGITALLIRRRN